MEHTSSGNTEQREDQPNTIDDDISIQTGTSTVQASNVRRITLSPKGMSRENNNQAGDADQQSGQQEPGGSLRDVAQARLLASLSGVTPLRQGLALRMLMADLNRNAATAGNLVTLHRMREIFARANNTRDIQSLHDFYVEHPAEVASVVRAQLAMRNSHAQRQVQREQLEQQRQQLEQQRQQRLSQEISESLREILRGATSTVEGVSMVLEDLVYAADNREPYTVEAFSKVLELGGTTEEQLTAVTSSLSPFIENFNNDFKLSKKVLASLITITGGMLANVPIQVGPRNNSNDSSLSSQGLHLSDLSSSRDEPSQWPGRYYGGAKDY